MPEVDERVGDDADVDQHMGQTGALVARQAVKQCAQQRQPVGQPAGGRGPQPGQQQQKRQGVGQQRSLERAGFR